MNIMKNCTLVLLLAVCGCMSYRFASEYEGVRNRSAVNGRYRIAHITFQTPIGLGDYGKKVNANNPFAVPDPWSIPQVASRMPAAELQRMIEAKYPAVFGNDAAAMPIDICISTGEEYKEYQWTILFPYLVSLGTLPVFLRTVSDCQVEVRPVASMGFHSSQSMRFVSDGKMTVFSPFGLIPYDRHVSALEQHQGNGIMSAPHLDETTRRYMVETFADSIATVVVAQLAEQEDKGGLPVVRPSPSAESTPKDATIEARLENLHKLHQKGLISDDEYKSHKAEILKSL